MASARYSTRSSAVKRILQELKELQSDTSPDYAAEAVEDNLFEWYFVVRGPVDTEFEGGLYHGRIVLPSDYPFKPPSFTMLTPNGRFETSTKICLSISAHHPEHWQPSWSLRTALTALIAFLPTKGHGAIGSLDFDKDHRQQLAAKSRSVVPSYGGPERRQLMKDLHARMLAQAPAVQAPAAAAASAPEQSSDTTAGPGPAEPAVQATLQPQSSASAAADAPAEQAAPQATRAAPAWQQSQAASPPAAHAASLPAGWEDRALTGVAACLLFLIAAIICRRVLAMTGTDVDALFARHS